jgi:DNA-directed RNA polymerase specialized sigma24 family protein
MSVPAVQPDLLENAWRFAHVLTGCAEGASRAFDEALAEIRRHPHVDEEDRFATLFFTILRRRCLKFPARNELAGRMAVLHTVPEPGRSALTLLCLNVLSSRELARVLSLESRALAETLEQSRASLRAHPV